MTEQSILERYPKERRFLLNILQDCQREFGYISCENIKGISSHLEVPVAEIFSMATFYKALSLHKKGKFIIKVCDGTACHIRGSVSLLDEIKLCLNLEPGETTEDGLFSLEIVNCVGSCAMAPVVLIGEEYCGGVTRERMRNILAEVEQ